MQQRIRKKYFSIGSITTSMLANSHWKYQYFIQAMNLLIHSITRIVNLPPRNRCPQSEPSSEYLSLETVNVFFLLVSKQVTILQYYLNCSSIMLLQSKTVQKSASTLFKTSLTFDILCSVDLPKINSYPLSHLQR